MRGSRWVWSCALVLLVWRVEGQKVQKMEDEVATKLAETQRQFLGVETQLSAARQVAELFALEDAQLELLTLETRARMDAIREETKREMRTVLKDVQKTKKEALANVTRWKNTLQGLKAATDKNRRVLKQIRDEKEQNNKKEQQRKREEKMLEMEQKQEEVKKEVEKKEMEKLQELEKQRQLEVQKVLDQEKKEELEKQEEAMLSSMDEDAVVLPLDADEQVGTVKRLIAWYVSAERTVVDAVATVYRQLVLPVVAILGFFLVLTVAIAKYNAVKQARRNRRVLYSGYPKRYRPKARQEANPLLEDGPAMRPRVRRTVPHRDPNDFIGN